MAQHTRRIKPEGGNPTDRDDLSFDEPVASSSGPDATVLSQEEREELASRMRRLDERELKVVESRFGFHGGSPLTLKEIGMHMGLTREWISVIRRCPQEAGLSARPR